MSFKFLVTTIFSILPYQNKIFTYFPCFLMLFFFVSCGNSIDDDTDPIPIKITISFDTQDGNAISNQTINKGEKLKTKPSNPTKANYKFNGWFTAQTGGNQIKLDAYIFNETTTLYAQWTQLQTFTITYHANKPQDVTDNPENVPTAPLIVIENRSISAPSPAPTLTNYDFIGWFEGTTTDTTLILADTDFDFTNTINESKELYAKWSRIQLIIAYNLNKPTGVTATITNPPNPVTISSGDITTEPIPKPTLEGYNFLGWYQSATPDNNAQPFDFSSPINQEKTLYAKWELKQAFTITYNENKPNGVTTDVSNLPSPVTVKSGDTTTEPTTAPTLTEYNFLGWYLSATPDSNAQAFDFTTTINENKNLYAKWTQDLVVTYNTQGGSNIQKQSVTHGGTITRPTNDPTRNHHTFDNWYTTAETGGQTVTFPYTVNENTTFYARWTRIQYTVTFNPNYPDAQTTEVTVNSGETTNPPDPQPTRTFYTFDNWYTTAETGGQIVTFPYAVTEYTTFYARWTRIQYTITFNPNYTDAQTTEIKVNSGEMATPLTPEPTRNGEFTFLNWHESTSQIEIILHEEPFNFNSIITENKKLYAKWTLGYVIKFDTQGGSIVNTQEIPVATTPKRVTRPNNPTRDCYDFENWYETPTPTQGETTFNFDSDITTTRTIIYARWIKANYNITFNFNFNGATTPYPIRTTNNEGKIIGTTPTVPSTRETTHALKGWYTQVIGGEKIDFTAQTFCLDKEVFAQWILLRKMITFDFNYTGKPAPTTIATNAENGRITQTTPVVPTDRANTHVLKGWYTQANGGEKIDFTTQTFTNIQTLYAQWTLLSKMITFDLNYAGKPAPTIIATNAENGRITQTTPVVPTDRANTHALKGWYTQANGGEKIDFTTQTFTDIQTLYAQWTFLSQMITFDLNYAGKPTPTAIATNTENGRITQATPVVPTDRANTHTLKGWYTLATGGEKIDFTTQTFTDIQTLYAQWNITQIIISFDTQEGSTVSEQNINKGGSFTTKPLDPTKENHMFKGWFNAQTGGEKVNLQTKTFNEPTTLYAQWNRIQFIVSFDTQDGTPVESQLLGTGTTTATRPTIEPTKIRHEFINWYENADGTGDPFNFTTTITKSITIYAVWKRLTSLVTFNTLGGSVIESQTIQYNKNVVRPEKNPTKENTIFNNWYDNEHGTGQPFNFANPIIEDIIVYAKWDRVLFNITFDKGYATTPRTTTEFINQLGKVYKPNPTPREKYKFLGWHDEATGGNKIYLDTKIFNNPQTLYAQWELVTITFNIGYGDPPTTTTQMVNDEGKIVGNNQPTREYYAFKGWFTTPTGDDKVNLSQKVFTIPTTLYAQWTFLSKMITFDLNYSGKPTLTTIETNTENGRITETLPVVPTDRESTHALKGWYTQTTGGEKINIAIKIFTAAQTLYAQWMPLFTITFNDNYGNTPNTDNVKTNIEGKVTKTTPQRDSYTFKGWHTLKTDGDKVDLVTNVFTTTQTLYAQWELVTITFNEGYGNPPTTTTQMVNNEGEIIGKDDPTRNLYTFNGWFTASNGGTKIELANKVFTTSTTIYAQWTITTKPTITFNENYGDTPNTDTVKPNHLGIVTKTDPQRDKYFFKGWYTSTTGGEKVNLETKIFESNQTLNAQWELVTITFFDRFGVPTTTKQQVNIAGNIVGKIDPTRELYTFSGWFTAATGGNAVNLDSKVFTVPTTIYAQWTRVTIFTITFNYNYGDTPNTDTVTINDEGKVTKNDPQRDRYIFKGWYTLATDGEKVNLKIKVFESNQTLFARWELVTITFNHGYGDPLYITKQMINEEGKIVGKTDPIREIYSFRGWFTETSGGNAVNLDRKIFTVPTIVNAQWTRAKYVVTFNYNNGNPPRTQPTKIAVNLNTKVSVPNSLPEMPHFTLSSWHTNSSLTDATAFDFENTLVTADISLFAKWTRNNYTVTFNHNDGNIPASTSTRISDQLGYIQKPTIPTHTNNNNKFVNWYTKASITDNDTPFVFSTQIIIADMNLYAIWTQDKIILSFNTVGGSDVPSQAITSGQSASRPNLIPTKRHFTFISWFTMEEGGEIYDFGKTINDDKTIYAHWRHRPETKAVLQAEINRAITAEGNNVDLNYINTSLITDMSSLFIPHEDFNGSISNWNVSAVKNMKLMFSTSRFNGNINNWNVSAVEDMNSLFYLSTFNGDISDWNVSAVKNMGSMFSLSSFNGNISNWNVSAVNNMSEMFSNARNFNQDLNNWNVSKVFRMDYMFFRALEFNGKISNWKPISLTDMRNMFQTAVKFKQNIESWNIPNSVPKIDAFSFSGLATNKPSWAN